MDSRSELDVSFKPRKLKRCFNNVLKESTSNLRHCIGEMTRSPLTTKDTDTMGKNIKQEAQRFHKCLCELRYVPQRCKFDLLLFQGNGTFLEGCFLEQEDKINTPFCHTMQQEDKVSTPFCHTIQTSGITCDIRRKHTVKCGNNRLPMKPQNTSFQRILNCISDSLAHSKCPETTVMGLTTSSTITSVAVAPQARIAIFVMALLVSLLLGILATALGVSCWRKKRRNSRPMLESAREGVRQINHYITKEVVCRHPHEANIGRLDLQMPSVHSNDYISQGKPSDTYVEPTQRPMYHVRDTEQEQHVRVADHKYHVLEEDHEYHVLEEDHEYHVLEEGHEYHILEKGHEYHVMEADDRSYERFDHSETEQDQYQPLGAARPVPAPRLQLPVQNRKSSCSNVSCCEERKISGKSD